MNRMTSDAGEIPQELATLLQADPKAATIFDALPDYRKAAHLTWISQCRTDETRTARAADIIRILHSEELARRSDHKRRGF